METGGLIVPRDFDIAIDIAAPPDKVAEVLLDGERWPEWTPTVTSVTMLTPAPARVGSRVRIKQPRLPPAVWTITDVSPAGFTYVSRSPGVMVVARHWVEPSAGGSRAHLALRFDGALGGIVGWLTAGLNHRYLGLEAEGLKQRCESKA